MTISIPARIDTITVRIKYKLILLKLIFLNLLVLNIIIVAKKIAKAKTLTKFIH